MKLPAYPRTKPSGVDWLGDVPVHWEVKPLKHLTDFINGAPFKPEDWSQDGVPIIRIENLNGGDNFNGYEGSVRQRYHVTKGDLLFGWSGNRGTSFGPFLWPREGLHYLNQHIFRLAHFSCDRSWFYWSLKAVTKTIEDEAHGIIGMVHVTKGKLGAVKIPSLPFAEQRAIAGFLDRETGRVDRLVAKKRELIERLKEKRTALISRTVTRGLPPAAARAAGLPENPPLKPSGLDWLGDIPKHWEVKRIGFLVQKVGSGKTPRGGSQTYQTEGVMLIRSQNVYDDGLRLEDVVFIDDETDEEMAGSRVNTRDVLLNITGASLGRCAVVPSSFPKANVNQHVCIIRPAAHKLDPVFAQLSLTAQFVKDQIFADEEGSSREGLNFQQVRNLVIPVPPLPEQAAIAAYLDLETAKLDELAGKVEAAVERLQEYRTALITAAVTGKIDVRGSVDVRPGKKVTSASP